MSVNANALKQYKSVDVRATVETASPHKLISMLFEGALKALAQAKGFCERSDIEGRTAALNKATEIVVSLKGSLDLEKGGEVAENLDSLYDYLIGRIYMANKNNDPEVVQEAMDLILELNTGWQGMPVELKLGEKAVD